MRPIDVDSLRVRNARMIVKVAAFETTRSRVAQPGVNESLSSL